MSRARARWLRCGLVVAVLVAGVLFAHPSPAMADLGGFTIGGFDTDLTVEPNSDLVVQERITVDFSEARHGIYRTIPIHYTDPLGYAYSIGFKLLGATDDQGQPVGTAVSHDGPYVTLRLGDANAYVDGRQVYLIRYRVQDAVKHFPDHDEIYWNAIGDEWQTTIQNATATVHLPDTIDASSIDATSYMGRAGSREQAADITKPAPSVVTYTATRPLEPNEAMTVVAAWPPGYVTFPGLLTKILRLLLDNVILVAPFLALGFMYRRYRRAGRDPDAEAAVMVQYEPPKGLTAAEIGTLVDEKVDLRDITASVVDLAIRGHLAIGQDEQKGFLTTSHEPSFERRTPTDTRPLTEHEQRVIDGLFASGDHVTTNDLREHFYTAIPTIRAAIYARLVEGGYFADDPDSVRNRYIGLGFLAGALTVGIGGAWAWLRGGIMPLALIVPGFAGVLVALVFVAFAPAMPRRTEEGVRMRNWARGFQEFVNRVEADKIAFDERRGVFEALLPFAMALGVAAIWARKFEGIYQAAAPAWYVGPFPPGGFSTVGMEHNLTSAMATTATVMAATPRPSGGSGMGGGGFSGGGFGGGGGGSW
jgi:hypothetical protein